MFAKIYFYAWLAIGAIAGVFYLTGNMTTLAIVVFGIVAFGMTFAGMMNVLPHELTHEGSKPSPSEEKESISEPAAARIPHGAHSVRA
jgi:hypothetical protein